MADNDQADPETSHDDQNYNFDMDAIYNDFIKEIDDIRSHAVFEEDNAEDFLKSLDPKQEVVKKHYTVIESSYQESRAHAFFRLIGLPVISADGSSYSPGHDNILFEERKIKIAEKIKIALNPIKDFNKLTTARESYVRSMLKVFSNPTSIDAGCMVISSGGTGSDGHPNIREFKAPFKESSDAFDMVAKSQQYEIKTTTRVGKRLLELSEFQDDAGNPPKISKNKRHIIKPLIVNGMIDFIVSPCEKRVCIPFVYDKANTKVSEGKFCKRPLVEKLIRDKFATRSEKGSDEKKVIEYIESFSKIKDVSIIESVSSPVNYDQTDRAKFAKSLKMITEMVKKLVEAANVIKKAQETYLWIPQPSEMGPEIGCQVADIFFPSTQESANLFTEFDKSILLMKAKDMVNSSLSAVAEEGNLDGEMSSNKLWSAFSIDDTESMGNASSESLEKMIESRSSLLTSANAGAKIVEIIMGEFSGFGLCDVFAITGAMNILPIEDLLGLIDIDAFERMEYILGIDTTGIIRHSPQEAVKNLTEIVKDFYSIMDQLYVIRSSGSAE